MATWNQSINPGSFLAGIGQFNENAPKASDANATIAMIRENNELRRNGGDNYILQGLQGLQSVKESVDGYQQKERMSEFLQKYGKARAAGDIPSMRGLFAEYPEMGEQIGKGMTGISADTKESIGNLAAGFRTAAATGSGDQFVAKNAAEFLRVGVDPADLQKRLKEDPNSAVELADWVGLSAVGHEKYFDIIDAKEGRQIDRGKLAETVRSNQAGEALTARRDEQSNARGWAGISIQKQNADIARERLNLDRELKGLEYKEKALDRQVSRETNELKRAELEQKLDGIRTQKEAAKAERYDTVASQVDSADRAIKTAQSIINSPGFTGYFGVNVNPFGSRFLPGTDASDTSAMVDTLKSQGFMSGIQQMRGMGALSDAEGRKVMDAIGSLDSGMSEKQAKKSIEGIIETFEQGKKRLESRYPDEFSKYSGELNQSKYGLPIGHQEGGYTYKGGDPSDKNNWSK
ncbi:phage DNA ejection protein [Morganella morganii]|uniref:phage DNA ejection protein n=1 Tax=Morganella morganii TaxID=582 RepID=UPI001BD6AE38|nr:phage DNA ejection protein [Morganella morganii]MBS9585685.1 phage DNA ejection protein [Morganella morganii subsp. morganii]QWL86916.1 phage DNA ejection protein [Morganella morganii subsp. morganii]